MSRTESVKETECVRTTERRARSYHAGAGNRRSAATGQNVGKAHTETETHRVPSSNCWQEEVDETTTRYSHEWESGYAPPDWKFVGHMYADEPLVVSPPACTPAGPETEHRLEATVYQAR